jgi:hypothetical protein
MITKDYYYYTKEIDLSIGVGIAGTPTSTLFTLLFCRRRSTLFLITRVTKPETVLTNYLSKPQTTTNKNTFILLFNYNPPQ